MFIVDIWRINSNALTALRRHMYKGASSDSRVFAMMKIDVA